MSKKRNRRNRWRKKLVKAAKKLQPQDIIVEARIMGIYVDDLVLRDPDSSSVPERS